MLENKSKKLFYEAFRANLDGGMVWPVNHAASRYIYCFLPSLHSDQKKKKKKSTTQTAVNVSISWRYFDFEESK